MKLFTSVNLSLHNILVPSSLNLTVTSHATVFGCRVNAEAAKDDVQNTILPNLEPGPHQATNDKELHKVQAAL